MLRRTLWLWLTLTSLTTLAARADLYQVGPGRLYETLQDVAPFLEPGDLVEVDGDNTYPGGVVFTEPGTAAQPIVIRGVRVNGNRPLISGGVNTVQFQTPDPYAPPGADWYVFEGFEVTGGTSRCIYHQAGNLVIRDTVVHDCPLQGILGADAGSGSLTLEYTEVYASGSGTQNHQIYMATDEVNRPGSVFRMQHCYVHDANGGNNVKSRAERNEIYYNWIEGAFYHELELIGPDPDGAQEGWTPGLAREDSDVVGNVLWKKGANETFFVTRIGGDGTGASDGRYRFVNNTFITGTSAVFRIFDGIESVEMHNNVFYRIGTGTPRIIRTVEADWATGSAIMAGSSNWTETGATDVPAAWTNTFSGADPGLADLTANDPRPVAGSPLLEVANSAPAGPPGFPFPSPLFPPQFHPPLRTQGLGTAQARPVSGALDIGAFELSSIAPPSITEISPSTGPTAGGQTVTITGDDLGDLIDVTFGGVGATVTSAGDSSITVTTPPSSDGTVVVEVNTAGGTATANYTYVLTGPAFISATEGTSSVEVSWPASFGATRYDVARKQAGSDYTIIGSIDGTLFIDDDVVPNAAYIYKVRAASASTVTPYSFPEIAVTLLYTDPSLAGVRIKALHVNQLRTAVNAIRALAGLAPAALTDPTITPGVTIVKAAHVTQLQSSLNQAREALLIGPWSFGPPFVSPSSIIDADHLTTVRTATQSSE